MNHKGNDCEACLRDDVKVDANAYCYDCSEKLCEDCKRHHKKNKLSMNHRLFNTFNGSEKEIDLEVYHYLVSLSQCPTHRSSTTAVKYLCREHDQLCCNECATVTHRKCKDISSLADEINEKTEETDVQKRLDTVNIYVDKLIKHETTHLANIYKKENEVKECLKDLKANLDAAYNKLEEKILLKMSERKESLSKACSLQIESAENLKEDIKEAGQKIKDTRSIGTNLHIFLLEREMDKKITQLEETLLTLRHQSSKESLILSEAIPVQETVRKIEDLYQIKEANEEKYSSTYSRSKDFQIVKLDLEREVSLHETQPRYCLWIENYIIVSFESSAKLEAYRADDGLLLSTYKCMSPTSVTATENDEFAVTLPTSNKINIMEIEQNQIVCIKQILVCSRPDLIAFNARDKYLLTLTKSEMLLKKITLDGKDAGCILLGGNIRNHLKSTLNIFVDSQFGHIFISSHGKRVLLCADMSGNQIFEHKIDNPWSVITDSQGNVYIASYSKNVIQKLCPDGKLITADLLEDEKVIYPMAMSFSKEMEKMVVTCYRELGQMRIYKVE